MKKFFVILFLIAGVVSCKEGAKDNAENKKAAVKDPRNPANETEENIYRSADSMMSAFKNKDWATFANYSHPAMIKMMGGQEAFVKLITDQMQQIPDTAIKSIGVGKIMQVVKTDQDQQCVVEQNMLMELQGMRITSTTYLVGESLNGGKSWTFFDASNGGVVKPKDLKPNLSPEIKVPEKKQDMKQM
ncbi:MAG TPA: hypothetical protein VF622_02755 [Segetibacter sp.]|jgi:hypothetical protein